MTPKDMTAHKQGRRHMAALAKVDERPQVELESGCIQDVKDTSVKGSNAQAVATATSSRSSPRKPGPSAPPASTVMGMVESTTPSESPRRARKKKGKTAVGPKKEIHRVVALPNMTEANDPQPDAEHTGWFYDPFPSNTYVSNHDYSICDQDCGWCGKCMDDVSLKYVLLSRF